MSFKSKATGLFPKAQWTGGSSIHASIARSGVVPLPFNKPRVILKAMLDDHFGAYIMRTINKHCPGMEWLYSEDEFEDLVMVDFYRLLHGQATMKTDKRLQNPSTGNYFHRITLLETANVVGGVRVWCEKYGADNVMIGYRFRLQEAQEAAKKERAKSRVKVAELEAEVAEIKTFAGACEPEVFAELVTEKELAFESFVLA